MLETSPRVSWAASPCPPPLHGHVCAAGTGVSICQWQPTPGGAVTDIRDCLSLQTTSRSLVLFVFVSLFLPGLEFFLAVQPHQKGIWFSPPFQFSSVQSLSRVQFFATPWTAARQASLSITNSQGLPKLIESVMPSNPLILCHPLLRPSISSLYFIIKTDSEIFQAHEST